MTKISRVDLAQVIAERTLHVSDTALLKKTVAAYLLEQNRVTELNSLMRDVQKYRHNMGYVEAMVVSAYPISSINRKELLSVIKLHVPGAKSYVVHEEIDENVISGVRIDFASEELDLTVRAKLNTLKRLTVKGRD